MKQMAHSKFMQPVSVTLLAAFSFVSMVSCSPFGTARSPSVDSAQLLESKQPIEVDLVQSFKEALTPKRPSPENCQLGENELKLTKAANFVLAGAACLTLGSLVAGPLWNADKSAALLPYGFTSEQQVVEKLNETNEAMLTEKRRRNPDQKLLNTLGEEQSFYREAIQAAQNSGSGGTQIAAVVAFIVVAGGSLIAVHDSKRNTGIDFAQDLLPAAWAGAKIASANIADLFANGLGEVSGKAIDDRIAKLSMSVEKIFNLYQHPVLEAVPDVAKNIKDERSGITRRVFRITPASTESAKQTRTEEFWSTHPHLRVEMTFDSKSRNIVADLFIQLPAFNSRIVKPEKLGSISLSLVKGKPEFNFVQDFQGIFGLFRWGSGHVAARLPGVVSLFQELVAQFAFEIANPAEASRLENAVQGLVPGEAIEIKYAGSKEPVYQLTRGELDEIIAQAVNKAKSEGK